MSFASNITQGSYEYVLMESDSPGFEEPSFSNAAVVGTPNTESFTINGLSSDTRYDLYIRSVCSPTSVSNFTCGSSFRTKCSSFSHFTTSFEDYEPYHCWSQLDDAGNVETPFMGNISDDPNTGSNALRFTNYNQDFFFTPEINNLSDGNNRFRLYGKVDFENGGANVPGDSELIVGTISNRSDANTFQPKDTIKLTTDYTRYTVDLESPSNDNYIAIKANYPSPDIAIDIDDITWEEIPNCLAPKNLSNMQTSNGDQMVSWTNSNSPFTNGYEYVVMQDGEAPNVSNAIQSGVTNVGQNSITLSGLNNSTDYDLYVRTICIGVKSPWSNVLEFENCNPQGYFSEDFEGYSSTTLPSCWNHITNSFIKDDQPVLTNFNSPNSGNAHLDFYSSLASSWSSYFISPSLSATPNQSGELQFYAKGDNNTTLEIGVMTDLNDESTFTSIESVNLSSSYQQFTRQISVAQAPHIVFKVNINDSSKHVFLDDISWSSAACSIPSNVELSNFTTSSLAFSWNDMPSASNGYEYVLMNDGDAPSTSNAAQTGTLSAGTTNLDITGLPNITQYDLYLRSDCGNDGKSDWSFKVDAKTRPTNDTPCNAIELTIGTTSSGTAYTNNGATSDPNEPEMNLNTGASKSVWFKFTAPQYGNVRLSTDVAGATLTDTEIALYKVGDCSDYSTYEQIGFDQDSGNNIVFNSILDKYRLNTGETYYLQVDPWVGSEGSFGIAFLDHSYIYNGTSWSPSNPIGNSNNEAAIILEDGDVNINTNTNAAIIDVYPSASLKIDGFVVVNQDIRFVSDQNGTGQFDEYDQVTQLNATVERHIPVATNNSRGYRFLTTSVETDQSIYHNWQESGESPDGYGTHITGSSSGANGFDPTQTGSPSMYTFDNSFTGNQSNAWNAIPNTDTRKLHPGEPYRIFIRGDRNYNYNSFPADPPNTDVKLRSSGNLAIGSRVNDSLSTKQNYFSLVGNPFQARVDITDVSTTNLNTNYYWIWDPNLSNKGAYAAVELPAGTTPSSSDVSQFVQPGQAFFVQTLNDGPASITFDQADKAVNELPTDVFSDDENYQMDIKLYQQDQFADGQPEADALRISFSADNDNAITQADAQKLSNPDENLARLQNGKYISIEKRQLPEDEETLDLFTSGYATDDYLFEIDLAQLPGNMTAYLVDEHEDEQIQLNTGVNEISFSVDQNIPESVATNRFSLKFNTDTLGNDEIAENKINIYPNPVPGESVEVSSQGLLNDQVSIKLTDISGRIVQQKTKKVENGDFSLKVGQYQAGVYILSLSSESETYQKRLIIK